MNKPKSAADPRPGNEPYYIDSSCENCGAELVLEDEDLPKEEAWHDEWRCRECGNLYLDWPKKELEKLVERKEEDDYIGLEEA